MSHYLFYIIKQIKIDQTFLKRKRDLKKLHNIMLLIINYVIKNKRPETLSNHWFAKEKIFCQAWFLQKQYILTK